MTAWASATTLDLALPTSVTTASSRSDPVTSRLGAALRSPIATEPPISPVPTTATLSANTKCLLQGYVSFGEVRAELLGVAEVDVLEPRGVAARVEVHQDADAPLHCVRHVDLSCAQKRDVRHPDLAGRRRGKLGVQVGSGGEDHAHDDVRVDIVTTEHLPQQLRGRLDDGAGIVGLRGGRPPEGAQPHGPGGIVYRHVYKFPNRLAEDPIGPGPRLDPTGYLSTCCL